MLGSSVSAFGARRAAPPLPPLRARLPVLPQCGSHARGDSSALEATVLKLARTNKELVDKNSRLVDELFEAGGTKFELQLAVATIREAHSVTSAHGALEFTLGMHGATTLADLKSYLSTSGSSILACTNASCKAVAANGGKPHTAATLAALLLDVKYRLEKEPHAEWCSQAERGPLVIPSCLSVSQRHALTCLLTKVGFQVSESAVPTEMEDGEENDGERSSC